MAKPASVPTWATDALYPAGTEAFSATATKVAAVAGLQAQGWAPKAKPAAQGMNYWQNLVGEWLTWLNAGVLDGVSLALSGNLSVGGTSLLTGVTTHGAAVDIGANKIRHTSHTKRFLFSTYDQIAPGPALSATAAFPGVVLAAAAADLYLKLPPIASHERLKSLVVTINGGATGSMSLMTASFGAVAFTPVLGAANIAYSGGTFTMTPTTPVAGGLYVLKVVADPASTVTVFGGDLSWDVVA